MAPIAKAYKAMHCVFCVGQVLVKYDAVKNTSENPGIIFETCKKFSF